MNFQKKPPQEIVEILAAKQIKYFDLSYYAYPEMFGSTVGPRRGIGGQSMSTMTVEAWECDGSGPVVYVCAGMYYFSDSKFEIFKKIPIDRWLTIPSSSKS